MTINPFFHALGKIVIEVPEIEGAVYYCPDTSVENQDRESLEQDPLDAVIDANSDLLLTKGYLSRDQMAVIFGVSYYQMTKIFLRMKKRGMLVGPEIIKHDKYYRFVGEHHE